MVCARQGTRCPEEAYFGLQNYKTNLRPPNIPLKKCVIKI